jgi:hypothetical protein
MVENLLNKQYSRYLDASPSPNRVVAWFIAHAISDDAFIAGHAYVNWLFSEAATPMPSFPLAVNMLAWTLRADCLEKRHPLRRRTQ